ncbi:hypothetical protein CCP3SC15_4640003 [Gammaproteobacteria bacterium]
MGLDTLVACAHDPSNPHERAAFRGGKWGERAQQELATMMPLRKLSLGVDETFFANMVLVAVDMVSGYIPLKKSSGQRMPLPAEQRVPWRRRWNKPPTSWRRHGRSRKWLPKDARLTTTGPQSGTSSKLGGA